jgi:hypothetical protein
VPRTAEQSVFLNVPYDPKFKDLYLAYIVGVTALGLVPKATLAITGDGRIDRIFSLITSCKYSIHDLSRVEVDARPPFCTPRFNMPFELGLAVAWKRTKGPSHRWLVFESIPRRIDKSLSDIKLADVYIHDGNARGVFRELRNALTRPHLRPTVPQMEGILIELKGKVLRDILRDAGTTDCFQAQVFADIIVAARLLASKYIPAAP